MSVSVLRLNSRVDFGCQVSPDLLLLFCLLLVGTSALVLLGEFWGLSQFWWRPDWINVTGESRPLSSDHVSFTRSTVPRTTAQIPRVSQKDPVAMDDKLSMWSMLTCLVGFCSTSHSRAPTCVAR